jgi:Peptidase family C25
MILAAFLVLNAWHPIFAQSNKPSPDTHESGRHVAASSDLKLLIVAPRAFRQELKDFTAFKQARMPAQLIELEEVLAKSSGADDAEKLKLFLFDQWKSHHAGYVLLVGDVDVMPICYMVLDRCTAPAFDYAFYGSDLYYADVAKSDGSFDDWNANKNGFHAQYIGEVRGEKNKNDPINYDQVSYDPELAVGRWPVSTPEEVHIVAAKSMAYELGVEKHSKPGATTIAFLGCGGWVDGRGVCDELAASLPNEWNAEKRYYTDANRNDRTPPPDAKQAVDLLNAGVGVMVHIGHGFDMGWAGSFSMNDFPSLHNADRLPIMISAGCGTGVCTAQAPYEGYTDAAGIEHKGTNNNAEVFTEPPPPPSCYQRGPHNTTSMGEQLLRRGPDGAVAYIGCNTGGQPCAVTLVKGFVQAISELKPSHGVVRLGDCWNSAVRYYIKAERLADLKPNNDWYPPSIFYQPMKYMVFGDPSLPMATKVNSEAKE